jgi:tetratricopeptide (TPR) repeat protein
MNPAAGMSSGRFFSESLHGRSHLTANPLVHAILICLVCFFSYSNTFHVPFQFDDPSNISGKPYVKDVKTFLGARPVEADSSFIMRTVTYFTFAVNYRLHGDEVVGYHVVNLAIHILNGFLVYFLLLLILRTPYFSNLNLPPLKQRGDEERAFIPLAAALLFVSHPVQTQAVTYIVQRLASLATLFYLLSLVMYVAWRQSSHENNPTLPPLKLGGGEEGLRVQGGFVPSIKRFFLYTGSFLAAVLAMKTKEIAFTLPLMITLCELLFFEGPLKKRFLFLAPLLLTMVIIPAGLMGITKSAGEVIGDVSEATKVGSALARWEYLFTEFRVIVTYIRLLIFPVNQNLDYDYPAYHSFFDPNVGLSFLFLLGIAGIGVYLLHRSRIILQASYTGGKVTPLPSAPPLKIRGGRGSYDAGDPGAIPAVYFRLIALGIFWFFMTLSIESSIIPITDVIFEHRLYLPSIGFFIAVTAGLCVVWERLKGKAEWAGKAAAGGFVAVVILLSVATYLRNNVWRSELTLWQDVAVKSPMKARSYNGLGLAYQQEGRIDEALESFARAVAIDPSYAVAYNSLGSAYFKKNLFGRAVEEFSKAIALDPGNAIFLNNRGLTYAALGETDMAIADYLEAIALDSTYDDAYHNLGSVFYGKGLYGRAVEEYTKAINLETDNAIYYNNRGLSYSALREFGKAITDYTTAIAIKPDFADAYIGRGVAYGELGRLNEAIGEFTRAISLGPSKASSYVNRAVAYERVKDPGMAMSDFQRACDLGDAQGCGGVEYLRKKYQAGK